MQDLGSFTICCYFEDIFVDKCLHNFGSNMNLILLSFFKKLNLANLTFINVILQLANCLLLYPIGIIKDILVKFDKFYFPTNFLVLNMEEDISIPIILCKAQRQPKMGVN